MIPGFGKQSITVGSGAGSDIRLGGPGVAAQHASIIREADGTLVFVNGSEGQTLINGHPLAPGERRPFDFQALFVVGQAAVPNAHPAIGLMLLEAGQAPLQPGQLIFGRDPSKSNIVVRHPSVSALHASIGLQPPSVTDHGSSGGTWLGRVRLEPRQACAVDPYAVVGVGPVPIPIQLVFQLAQSMLGTSGGNSAAVSGAAAGQAPSGGTSPKRKHKTVIGQLELGSAGQPGRMTIGRTPDNDIQISHPQVSSKHAVIHRLGSQLFLEDSGSANGTYVRGQRISVGQRVPVANGEKVFIGPMPLLLQIEAEEVAVVIEDQAQWAGRPLYEIEAWDLVLQVPDRDNPNELKTLLDHVSFKALPGDLIALMGPSGAGKTTLLLTLNGYMPPSGGQVRINGQDLYSIYDALRGSIGYVPQDDIVHPELTVWEAVRYSAKFRLPPDFSEEEIERRVETTLAQLGLESVAHLQIGKPERKILSGGQRKRVNIAMELVTDPVIMFLDEPTSGLAADDTSALVQLLAELARQTGKTIITTIHQPAKDEFEKFNLALIMGPGGIPIYYGPTKDGYRFFGSFLERLGETNTVDNPRDMFEMLNRREKPIFDAMRAQNPTVPRIAARQESARQWHAEFFNQQNPIFQQMYSGRRAVGTGSDPQGVPQRATNTQGQFGLLLGRYFRVKARDVGGTAIMLLQAPIIGVLLALVFGWQKDAIPYWCLGALQELGKRFGGLGEGTGQTLGNMQPTPDHSAAIFFLVVAAVWFGTSNAAREIVSERGIYRRERMVNLKLFNYVFSKFFLLSVFCAIQCTVLLAIVFFSLGFEGGPQAFAMELGVLTITSINSAALGLLLSSMVESSEAAMALTPIALIPQVVLGGLMVPMTTNPLLEWPMYLIPARWGFEGMVTRERAAIADAAAWVIEVGKPDLTSPDNFVTSGRFECATAQLASADISGAWGFTHYDMTWLPASVLGASTLLTLMVVLVILKRRDSV